MALYMIGLGLFDEKDITLRGLEAVKRCEIVFLEDYTSKLSVNVENLEKLYGKKILLASREIVEKHAGDILDKAKEKDVAFLVVGDVFSATTHVDFYLRAKEKDIPVHIIYNTSIVSAVGLVGLELYKFGKTTSMPYFEKGFRPRTPYEVIGQNQKAGMHTLILLDIKKDLEKYMTVNEGLHQFLDIEADLKQDIVTKDTFVIGCARLGSDAPEIRYGKVSELLAHDFGKPLHCIIVPGKLHFMEEEMLKLWS
ncbi:MAG: diphthine synthase [Nanoarchaeota archaeon]|nr:diphthine synthase [Nanoarchaeota archaeon]